ncbi:MAG TPA: FAD-binding protein, partial [Patescibacteria group bacterium]
SSKEEILEAVVWAKEKNIPFFILGSGANILVGDRGYRGLVVKNEAKKFVILGSDMTPESSKEWIPHQVRDDKLLTAESGAIVGDIITKTSELGLSGFEHFAGIPSTVGGALWQNLHFLSPDRSRTVYISEILESAEVLSFSSSESEGHVEKGEGSRVVRPGGLPRTTTVTPDYFKFGYDYSTLHESQDIVLSATFKLVPKTPEEVQSTVKSNLDWRASKHPENAVNRSAGSVFKKIEGHGAGRLIQEVGLKGHQIGGAKISDKHANFIVNERGATAKDVRDLIELVEKTVKEKLGLSMQPEISFVGEF